MFHFYLPPPPPPPSTQVYGLLLNRRILCPLRHGGSELDFRREGCDESMNAKVRVPYIGPGSTSTWTKGVSKGRASPSLGKRPDLQMATAQAGWWIYGGDCGVVRRASICCLCEHTPAPVVLIYGAENKLVEAHAKQDAPSSGVLPYVSRSSINARTRANMLREADSTRLQ